MFVKLMLVRCCVNRAKKKKDAPCFELLHSLTNADIVKDGTLDNKKIKILLDTGSQTSVARADLVAKEKWDPSTQISVRCVHGDLAYYPTAEVQVGIDGVLEPVRVALIPEMPVDLLIGVNDFSSGRVPTNVNHNMVVMTRQQKRQQAAQRQKNLATTVTASPFPVVSPAPSIEAELPVQDGDENFSPVEAENVPTEEVVDSATEDDSAIVEPEVQEEKQENTCHYR